MKETYCICYKDSYQETYRLIQYKYSTEDEAYKELEYYKKSKDNLFVITYTEFLKRRR